MSERRRLRGPLAWPWLGLAVLLFLDSPARACDADSGWLAWDRCWSPLRFFVWLLTLVPAAWLAYQVFRSRLEPSRANPPVAAHRPGPVPGPVVGAGRQFVPRPVRAFVGRPAPAGMAHPPAGLVRQLRHLHWQWLVVLVATVVGAWPIAWSVRHQPRTA